jgi:hypothetical protein
MSGVERWSEGQAWDWARARGWQLGCNFVPSTAVNSTEQWQAETFDPDTVDRELGWAADLGLTAVRINLQYLVHEADPDGHLDRLDRFFTIAARHGIAVMPVLFDDCAFSGKQPYLGVQDEPVPGVHNSGWTPSPGHAIVADSALWAGPERYVREVIDAFRGDERVLAWDLYNEPGNHHMLEKSAGLLNACFDWARAVAPSQPLTAGLWYSATLATIPAAADAALRRLGASCCALSDVISFHNYDGMESLQQLVTELRAYNRPLLCTEWLRRCEYLPEPRPVEALSLMETHLPYFHAEQISCFNWGLVNGRQQTHFPWDSRPGTLPPDVWFHDLLDANGVPHRSEEVDLLRQYSPRRAVAIP